MHHGVYIKSSSSSCERIQDVPKSKEISPNNSKLLKENKCIEQKYTKTKRKFQEPKNGIHSDTEPESLTSKKTCDFRKSERLSQKVSSTYISKIIKAIEENSYDDCKYLIENEFNQDLHDDLSTILKKAFETSDNNIKELIFTKIENESPKLIQRFCRQYSSILSDANVWIGVSCQCDKAVQSQYENEPCRQSKLLIVIEVDDLKKSEAHFPKHFLGFETRFVDMHRSNNQEATQIAEEMVKRQQTISKKVPGSVAKSLFKKHSTLTMVCPSEIKSEGFITGPANLQAIYCIQLFCKQKGIIPIGEFHFPLKVDGIPTDVLEGTSQFSSAVHIGDTIYNEKGQTGTLGGFIKYYGIDTFLTCSHVIFGKNDFFKLRNKDIHFKCHIIRNNDKLEPVECVLIRHSLKYDTQEKDMEVEGEKSDHIIFQDDPEETSIDAGLLLIKIPESANTLISKEILTRRSTSAGTSCCNKNIVELRIKLLGGNDSTQTSFSEYGLDSIYLNENVLDPDDVVSQALALSSYSGKQEGYVILHKEKEVKIPIPTHVRTRDNIILYNQYSLQNMQFQDGDSGTCIYGKCMKSGKKGCIGMLIAKSTSGQYIITPMKDILNALGVNSIS